MQGLPKIDNEENQMAGKAIDTKMDLSRQTARSVRRMTLVCATFLLIVLPAACAGITQDQPPAQDDTLQDTEWVLTSLNGSALIRLVLSSM